MKVIVILFETEELATEETTSESVTVELVMVGDMLLHDVVQFTGKMPDGTYNYDHFFTHVRENIQSADVAVVNQHLVLAVILILTAGKK